MPRPLKYFFRILCLCLPGVFLQPVHAQQPYDYPFDQPGYRFIRYDTNQFELVRENPAYQTLFAKFDELIRNGDNQISIVHIGGSHIQADVYTHRIRQELQSFYPGILGSRGFFFPYSVAHTNSPSNLWIHYSGTWQTCKNTQSDPAYTLGLSGITSVLTSSSGSITLVARYDTLRHYDFNRVRLFCNGPATGAIPLVNPGVEVTGTVVDKAGSYIQYNLGTYTDTLRILIQQSDSTTPFQLYGISLENDDPGVVYNSIGVNGAKLNSYLRCGLFVPQLQALNPDWVILSIGTNEGNTRQFDALSYEKEYLQMIDSVRLAAPNAAILLTVPNDSYLYRRYTNHNTARMRALIFAIASARGCGVWDFYTVMGGLNSATVWYNNGLMNKDHIHFNRPGYLLKGDLFFNAFLRSWETHLTVPEQHITHLRIPISYPYVNQEPAHD